jgi:16S rRNA processing protein RimM
VRSPSGVETTIEGVRGRDSGKHLVARFPGVEDRDAVEAMRGTEIYVPRSALPPPNPDEYYWVDLEGLDVKTTEGVALGQVSHLFSTGANDVVVVRGDRERMIPFVLPDFVVSVDFEANLVVVDWDPEF